MSTTILKNEQVPDYFQEAIKTLAVFCIVTGVPKFSTTIELTGEDDVTRKFELKLKEVKSKK